MTEFRIKQAFAYALAIGLNITRMDLAERIWDKSNYGAQKANVSHLFGGKTKSVTPKIVKEVCELTTVDANFLFNIKQMKGVNDE